MSLVEYLDNKFYPDFQKNWDDHLFREKVLAVIRPEHDLLDMGAGAGIIDCMNFRGLVRSATGIDLDERVTENPFLDKGFIGDVTQTPFDDGSFDIIICDNVMEHIEKPEAFLDEVARLLKPGGIFLGKTPNKWHYMPLIAANTPLWFHKFYNKLRGRNEEDTFPTHYRLNTPADVRRLASGANLETVDVALYEGRPEYLRIFFVLYLFGIFYERLVNKVGFMRRFAILLVTSLKKPG
ncbi:class I SAM-dependent methyltransferase [Kordiimonas sp.]|uniref:class I SAM-dependent methyltransferase n=1 Tax=Kordiimonas sp. TaxID=1970157 RepID=UPI003A8EFC8A